MKGIQDTTSSTLRQLLGNGLRYVIPRFQRDYSWTAEQWDDLWRDMEAVRTGEDPAHYLGYLVLQTQDDKEYKVIDGQQRLTTLSIFILACIKRLSDMVDQDIDPEQNTQRIATFRSSYIGYLDPVTLVPRNKLRLNRNNDDFYRQYIVPLISFPRRGINTSEKLMRNSFEWFHSRLTTTFATGESIAEFLDDIVDKLFFTVITVDDELNAFRVFETLNARGVQLSSADLLKNYLFSIVDAQGSHASEITEIESLWSQIIGKLGSRLFPQFLRTYWNSRNRTVRKNELFKAIRMSITTKAEAFALVRNLLSSADTYSALRNPDDELWTSMQNVPPYLRELKLFQVSQPIALLLAAYETLSLHQFERVLKSTVVVSFRYNIIGGLNPNDQEKSYNNIALQLRDGNGFAPSALSLVYPSDSSFEAAFANVEFGRTPKAHKLIRYIFEKLDRQIHTSQIDGFSSSLTVEHILPENPDDGAWDDIPDDTLERCVYRLGNLTLLESRLNRDAASRSYEDKKRIFSTSDVASTKAIVDRYDKWNEANITARQRAIARVAKGVWQLPM
ncbi:MAG: DUF262 domain-containing protein [Lewinella sp.]